MHAEVKTEDYSTQKIDFSNMSLSKLAEQVKGEEGYPSSIQPSLEKKEDMALIFQIRQTLNKKYNTAMCHGSRLICDADVYDKKFNLI